MAVGLEAYGGSERRLSTGQPQNGRSASDRYYHYHHSFPKSVTSV